MTIKLAIGALAVASVLAFATGAAFAAPPSIQFGFTIGDQPPPPPPPHHLGPPPPSDDDCVPLKQIFGMLSDEGYYSFKHYDDADDDYFTVDARYGQTRRYHLAVDNCTGDIMGRKRIYQQPF